MTAANQTVGPRLRIVLEPGIAIGPGKADLLQGIEQTGSIAAAGRLLGMSYKRAWSLIEILNRDFGTPLVITAKGGNTRGGAALTLRGKTVLALYRQMEERTNAAITEEIAAMRDLLPPKQD